MSYVWSYHSCLIPHVYLPLAKISVFAFGHASVAMLHWAQVNISAKPKTFLGAVIAATVICSVCLLSAHGHMSTWSAAVPADVYHENIPRAEHHNQRRDTFTRSHNLRLLDHHLDTHAEPTILILSPVKNAMKHLQRYFANVGKLTYPHDKISIGLMDSDSNDEPTPELVQQIQKYVQEGLIPDLGSSNQNEKEQNADSKTQQQHNTHRREHNLVHSGTLYSLLGQLPRLQTEFRRVTVFQHNFGLPLHSSADRHAESFQLQRRKMLARSRNHLLTSALVDEDYVLWIDSDLLEFPADIIEKLLASGKQIVVPNCVMSKGGRSYDLNSWRVADDMLGNDATVEQVVDFHDSIHKQHVNDGDAHKLELEGYANSGHLYLHKLRSEGDVVRLDAVGGAMLLVDAELHRHGLMFPPFVYRHRIETEGLSMMALDMGVLSWGMPNVEIIHK